MSTNNIKILYQFFEKKDQFLQGGSDVIWNEFTNNYLFSTLLYPYEFCLRLFDRDELIELYKKHNKEAFIDEGVKKIREYTQNDPEVSELLSGKWKELCEILF